MGGGGVIFIGQYLGLLLIFWRKNFVRNFRHKSYIYEEIIDEKIILSGVFFYKVKQIDFALIVRMINRTEEVLYGSKIIWKET